MFRVSVFLYFLRKIHHLSRHRWKHLCTKAFEHGRDVFDPSHIPPVAPPIDLRTARGRDDGRDMGGMTGEMKNVESLYLKAFRHSDGRDGHVFEIFCFNSASNASSTKHSMCHDLPCVGLIIPTVGMECSQLGNKVFPAWEYMLSVA